MQFTEHVFVREGEDVDVFVREGEDVDKVLGEREKYWQAQLFTLTHRLNNVNERYALNRQGYRK